MHQSELEYIRKTATDKSCTPTVHALERMSERMIYIDDVYEAIKYGPVIEQQKPQKAGQHPRVLFQHSGENGPDFYVVVACCVPPCIISTVRFEDEHWQNIGGIMRRIC